MLNARTTTAFLAGAVALMVAGCSGGSAGIVTAEPSTPTTPASSAPTATPAEVAQEVTDSTCLLGGIELTGTVLEPFPVDSIHLGGVTMPSSGEYGPGARSLDHGYYYCFEHSPGGAVMAAISAVAQTSGLGEDAFEPWYAYITQMATDAGEELPQSTRELETTARTTMEGFKVLQYDGQNALIDVLGVVTIDGTETYVGVIIPMVWYERDWRIDVNSDTANSTVLTSPDGYVLFESE